MESTILDNAKQWMQFQLKHCRYDMQLSQNEPHLAAHHKIFSGCCYHTFLSVHVISWVLLGVFISFFVPWSLSFFPSSGKLTTFSPSKPRKNSENTLPEPIPKYLGPNPPDVLPCSCAMISLGFQGNKSSLSSKLGPMIQDWGIQCWILLLMATRNPGSTHQLREG